jgi:serine/threonine-protein kinase RsbW
MDHPSMDSLTVPGTLDSLGAIGEYVEDAAAVAGLDRKSAYNLRLAVDEVATNTIIHGYQEAGTSGDLTVQAEVTDDAVAITIEDTAAAYDPRGAELPDDDELSGPLQDRPVGGLGLFLAFTVVDEFDYERVGDRNRNRLLMRLPDRRADQGDA